MIVNLCKLPESLSDKIYFKSFSVDKEEAINLLEEAKGLFLVACKKGSYAYSALELAKHLEDQDKEKARWYIREAVPIMKEWVSGHRMKLDLAREIWGRIGDGSDIMEMEDDNRTDSLIKEIMGMKEGISKGLEEEIKKLTEDKEEDIRKYVKLGSQLALVLLCISGENRNKAMNYYREVMRKAELLGLEEEGAISGFMYGQLRYYIEPGDLLLNIAIMEKSVNVLERIGSVEAKVGQEVLKEYADYAKSRLNEGWGNERGTPFFDYALGLLERILGNKEEARRRLESSLLENEKEGNEDGIKAVKQQIRLLDGLSCQFEDK